MMATRIIFCSFALWIFIIHWLVHTFNSFKTTEVLISVPSCTISLFRFTVTLLGIHSLPNALGRRLLSPVSNHLFVRKAQFCSKMNNFLPTLNSNKHHTLLQDSVRTCILEELAQVQVETDEHDTKYKHVAAEVSLSTTSLLAYNF